LSFSVSSVSVEHDSIVSFCSGGSRESFGNTLSEVMGCKMKIPTEIFFIAYKFLFFSSKWQKKYFRKFVETKNARKSSTGDINPNTAIG
jgi:hypothetical protein